MPAGGGPTVRIAELPFRGFRADVVPGGDATRDGQRFVLAIPDTRSDVWMIDNFDSDGQ